MTRVLPGGELNFKSAWGEIAFGEEYEILDFAWGGTLILNPKWRLFEAFQQEQNQKFSQAVQL